MSIYLLPIPSGQYSGEGIKAHLNCEDVSVNGNNLVIVTSTHTAEQLEAALKSYVYVAPKEPTVLEKLDSIGVTIPELKAALGL